MMPIMLAMATSTESTPAKLAPFEDPGPVAGLRQLADFFLRDTSICRGPDGLWYMTGTSAPKGIAVWRSSDMKDWRPLGTVWEYGKSPWHKRFADAGRPLWAPEIHYLKGTFWLTYSMPDWDAAGKVASGSGLLKSTSGKAEGPYVDMHPDAPLGDEIDASLFQDDDGKVYFVWHCGKVALMKDDMSGFAAPYRLLRPSNADADPKHHSDLCAGIFGKDSFDHVGYEGAFIFKRRGTYYLCCSENYDGRYSCSVATSKHLFGPYDPRYEALPHAGHNTLFRDERGDWWSTYFGSDASAPWQEKPGVLPVRFDRAGRLSVVK